MTISTDSNVIDVFNFLIRLKQYATNTPKAHAIQYQSNILTYSELDKKSTDLAGYLQALGIQKSHIVGVMLPHCLELSVSLIGVLKAGAAYLPLDPEYPEDRIKFMIHDTHPEFIITRRNLLYKIKDYPSSVKILIVDDLKNEHLFTPLYFEKNDLAYIIYTSGSTGKPKGVMITHHNLNHFLKAVQHAISITSTDRFFSVTSISFDIFALELFLPLSQGACCLLNDINIRTDPSLLEEALQSSQATFLQATPATYAMLIQSGWKNDHLRGLLCGGESWDITLARKIFNSTHKKIRLWNMYGPTEATIWCACQEILPTMDKILIGSPLSGNEFLLINGDNEVEDEGELIISGENVAAGYFNRPEIKDKFITNFLSKNKVYRTGDWVRRIDESFQYLSRIDRQIKLRGFRVELSEIEHRINEYPGIVKSAVIVTMNGNDIVLTAFMTTMHQIKENHIKEHLKISLPFYMIPNHFHFITQFPLTPTGKVDSKKLEALAAKENLLNSVDNDFNTLQNNQNKLKAIWSELLKVNSINENDNFFDLGGHSLLAVRLTSRIRNIFNITITLQEIFKNTSFTQMLKLIEDKNKLKAPFLENTEFQLLQPKDKSYPLTREQQDNWDYHFLLGGEIVANSPSAILIRGVIDLEKLEQAFDLVLSHYSVFQYQFIKTEPGIIQRKMKLDHFKWCRYLTYNETESVDLFLERFVLENESRPFKLDSPPLLRASIINLNSNLHLLVTNNHHIIMDGWAKSIFFKKIGEYYQQLSKNKEFKPEKNIQYENYLEWYFTWQKSDAYHKQVIFWQNFLKDKLKPTTIINIKNTDKNSFAGDIKYFTIEPHQKKLLENISKNTASTLFSTLLAAFYLTLASYNHEKEQLISTVAFARTQKEFEDVIGLLANTLLIPITIEETSIVIFIQQVHNNSLAALSHQDLPFENVLESLGESSKISKTRPGNVMFLYQNLSSRQFSLGENIDTLFIPLSTKISILDFLFEVRPHEEGSLKGSIEFRLNLFNDDFINEFIMRYQKCLDKMTTSPTKETWTLINELAL